MHASPIEKRRRLAPLGLQRYASVIYGSWIIGQDGSPVVATSSTTVVSADPAVHAHNMRVILESEGVGTVGERLAAYARAYGLTADDVMEVTGVSVELVAAKTTAFDVEIEGVSTEVYEKNAESMEAPNSENTMIVVIYGSNQFPNQQTPDQASQPGFDDLVSNLKKHYAEVWPLISGENPDDHWIRGFTPNMHIEVRSQIIKNESFISTRKNLNQNIQYVVLVGYSWGGGQVYEIANWLTNESGLKIKIAATIYVDAVSVNTPTQENRIPPGTKAMLNIFQSKSWDSGLFLNGGKVINNTDLDTFTEIDLDNQKNVANHSTIDEMATSTIIDFIQKQIPILQ